MPRQARLDVPGALHHIMVRGINRSAILKDDQDKVRFLDRLSQNISEGHCFICAWVLMDNHPPPFSKRQARHIRRYAEAFDLVRSEKRGRCCIVEKLIHAELCFPFASRLMEAVGDGKRDTMSFFYCVFDTRAYNRIVSQSGNEELVYLKKGGEK